MTDYNEITSRQIATDQDEAALRSLLFELRDLGTSWTKTLHFRPSKPETDAEHRIKTIPGRGWFVYFRVYGPSQGAFDGSWRPGDFEVVATEEGMK